MEDALGRKLFVQNQVLISNVHQIRVGIIKSFILEASHNYAIIVIPVIGIKREWINNAWVMRFYPKLLTERRSLKQLVWLPDDTFLTAPVTYTPYWRRYQNVTPELENIHSLKYRELFEWLLVQDVTQEKWVLPKEMKKL